jgi:hypothetical protein
MSQGNNQDYYRNKNRDSLEIIEDCGAAEDLEDDILLAT